MLNKLKCWLFGHKRGRRVTTVTTTEGFVYECPRCGRLKKRKTRKAKVA